MEHIIADYISQELITNAEAVSLQPDTPLIESNLVDSTALMNLVLFLEERFGVSIGDTDLTRQNFETIRAICACVRARQPEVGAAGEAAS